MRLAFIIPADNFTSYKKGDEAYLGNNNKDLTSRDDSSQKKR